MSAEIAVRPAAGMTLADKMTYSKALAVSNLLPSQYRQNPANLLFALEYAEALGVAPIHAITSIHVIEGKPSASADLIATMVRRAGHRLRVTGDDTFALAQIIRADDPEFTFEARWDISRARSAELTGKKVWKQYPAAMLRSRAITEVARAAAPDALFGVQYTPEELGAEVDNEGTVISAPASRTDQAAPPPPSSEPAEPAAPRPSASERLRAAKKSGTTVTPGPIDAPEARERARQEEAVDTATVEVLDAEIVPEPITPKQLTALNAALTALGFTDRADKLAHLSAELGRDIESSKELSKDEASLLIDKIKAHEVPVASAGKPSDTFVEEPPADWEPEP